MRGMSIVDQAIAKVGGVAEAARTFGVSHVSIIGWKKRGAIPADKLRRAADLTGFAMSDLNPRAAEIAAAFAPAAEVAR